MNAITFNAPSPAAAYAQAPDLDAEAATVAELLAELDPTHRPDFYPAASPAEQHEVYIRAAAVADRRWLADQSPENLAVAEEAAALLMEFDRWHPDELAGPFSPRSIEWAAPGGCLAYVRQEYAGWLNGPITADCNNCQGETCRQCARPTEVPSPAVAPAPVLDDPAARVHRFLGADPRATVCGQTDGPDSPMELTVADLYAVLNGNATKAQEGRVRAFVDEWDSLRDTDHPQDNDHISTAPGGAVLHSDDVRALLDNLNPHREDPTDVLPVLLAWPAGKGEYRIRRDQLGDLIAYVEDLDAGNH